MGEYESTTNTIAFYQDIISDLRAELSVTEDEDKRADLLEAIADYEISIGECEGYLQELASMDGYRSYEEMLCDCMYEEVQYAI